MRMHWTRCGLGAAFLLAVPTLCFAGPGNGRPGTLAQERAAARREGLPLTPREMARKPVRDADNAAPLYRKLTDLLKAKPISREETDLVERDAMKADAAPADIAKAAAFFAQRKDVMDLIHRASERPECDFRRDWKQGPAMLFPEFARLRTAARLLSCEANVQLHGGDAVGAARTCAAVGRIGRHVSADSFLIAHLVAYAIEAIGVARLEAILQRAPTPEVAAAVTSALREYRPRPLSEAMRGEAVIGMVSLGMVRKDPNGLSRVLAMGWDAEAGMGPEPKLSPAAIDRNTAYLIWLYRAVHRTVDLPYPQARPTFQVLGAELEARRKKGDPNVVLASLLSPVYTQVVERAGQNRARRSALLAAVSAVAWRARHGSLPRSLAACMKAVPMDPFDGKPLRYRVEGKGFVIYSIGPTGKYAGAPKEEGKPYREVAVRWPAPAKAGR
jgi:hypothetical protein